MKLALVALALILSGSWDTAASESSWEIRTIRDPMNNLECEVHKPTRYGLYIYFWRSKYDAVYWPHTDSHWLWYCAQSGYASFGDDFNELTLAEAKRIKEFLNIHHVEPIRKDDPLARFLHTESIYRLRNKDDGFWSWFYRLKAHWLEAQANIARQRSMPLMEDQLEQMNPGFDKILTLFVLGDYNRRFGDNDTALALYDQAKNHSWSDMEGTMRVGNHYVNELIAEQESRIAEAKNKQAD